MTASGEIIVVPVYGCTGYRRTWVRRSSNLNSQATVRCRRLPVHRAERI